MTSDAKIGLLLGLVFIFAIAFIINGLPRFAERGGHSELTTNMAGPHKEKPIAANERAATKVISRLGPPRPIPAAEPAAAGGEPAAVSAESTASAAPRADDATVRFEMPVPEAAQAPARLIEDDPSSGTRPLPSKPAVEARGEPVLPAGYVVQEGDNLTAIARRFYGQGAAVETAGVKSIYQANRGVLKSPDDLFAGQKIAIPALREGRPDLNAGRSGLDGAEFEKVSSIGRKTQTGKPQSRAEVQTYVVAEGDSLWKIAAKRLGDGRRYDEIARLNADTLDDEDNIFAGMRLKLPAR